MTDPNSEDKNNKWGFDEYNSPIGAAGASGLSTVSFSLSDFGISVAKASVRGSEVTLSNLAAYAGETTAMYIVDADASPVFSGGQLMIAFAPEAGLPLSTTASRTAGSFPSTKAARHHLSPLPGCGMLCGPYKAAQCFDSTGARYAAAPNAEGLLQVLGRPKNEANERVNGKEHLGL